MTQTIDVSKDQRVTAFKIADEMSRHFDAMSYSKKLEFARKNPDLVKIQK